MLGGNIIKILSNEKKEKRRLSNLIKNNKKKLLVLTGISIFTVLGGTLAYFTTSTTITNFFNTAKYETQIVENFVSPDNWTPDTTTSKDISVTNKGTIDMALRVSYTEEWTDAHGDKLPLKDSNDNVAALIHFNSDWVQDTDGYFYYGSKNNLTKLTPNNTSTSFISGVTFNKNITADLQRTESADKKIITYESTGQGYDGAKYTLTIKIDTIQFDQANNVW